jgi:hypothetical protein
MEVLFATVGLALLGTAIFGANFKGPDWIVQPPRSLLGRALLGALGLAFFVSSLAIAGIWPPRPEPRPSASDQANASGGPSASAGGSVGPVTSPTGSATESATPRPSLPTPSIPAQPTGPWRGMPARFNDGIDAAVTRDVGLMYLFENDEYVRFNDLVSGMSQPPVVTAGNWHGMPSDFKTSIDAAALNKTSGAIYFFKGPNYIRFTDLTKNAIGPITTADNWRGMPTAFNNKLDAALTDAGGRIYFFRGSSFVRFTNISQGVDPGYPKSISSYWSGLPPEFEAGIDAALTAADGTTFFFKGSRYVRFSPGQTSVDLGYPVEIGG